MSIQFQIASGECPNSGRGAFNSCDDSANGGMCAYSADEDISWCCPPGDEKCGRWGQTCRGAGSLAGPGQIYCQLNSDSWCCDSQTEVCIQGGAINLCRTKFKNPYSDVSKEQALSLKSAYFATASSTKTSASTSQAPSTTSTDQASQITSAVANSNTNNPPPSPTFSSLSAGAIAGIVIGVLALVLVAAATFFLIRKRSQKSKSSDLPHPHYAEVGTEPTYKDTGLYDPPYKHELMDNGVHGHGVHELQGAQRSELP